MPFQTVKVHDRQAMVSIRASRDRPRLMDDHWYRRLGARIARLRARAGLTQEQLAEKAGIGASYVARIETGGRRPTLDVLGELAGALGVPVYRLLVDERGTKAAEEFVAFRGGRTLGAALTELDDPDVELLLKLAQRLRSPHR